MAILKSVNNILSLQGTSNAILGTLGVTALTAINNGTGGAISKAYNNIFSSGSKESMIAEMAIAPKILRAKLLYNRKETPGKIAKTRTSGYKGEVKVEESKGKKGIISINFDSTKGAIDRTIAFSDKDHKGRTVMDSRYIYIFNPYGASDPNIKWLRLQTSPQQIEFKPESQWSAINSMGRNVPIYHYTGAEDTMQFNISWYVEPQRVGAGGDRTQNIDQVLNKCRILESWTKADGYKAAPPVLQLMTAFGHTFGGKECFWILESATYTLKNYSTGMNRSDYYNKSKVKNGGTIGEDLALYSPTGYLAATQELVFKKVSQHNPMYSDLFDPYDHNYLNSIPGVNDDIYLSNNVAQADTNYMFNSSQLQGRSEENQRKSASQFRMYQADSPLGVSKDGYEKWLKEHNLEDDYYFINRRVPYGSGWNPDK